MPDPTSWRDEAIAALIAAVLAVPVALSIVIAIVRTRSAARRGRPHPAGGSDNVDLAQDHQSIASRAFRSDISSPVASGLPAMGFAPDASAPSENVDAGSSAPAGSVDSGSSHSDQ